MAAMASVMDAAAVDGKAERRLKGQRDEVYSTAAPRCMRIRVMIGDDRDGGDRGPWPWQVTDCDPWSHPTVVRTEERSSTSAAAAKVAIGGRWSAVGSRGSGATNAEKATRWQQQW